MKHLNDYVEDVERQIEYTFDNVDLLFQAFTRRSYSQEKGGENNEILEFIGDRVLDFYVTKILIDRYGYIKDDSDVEEFAVEMYDTEGSLTEIKKKLVNKMMLAHRIDILGFNCFLFMGKGDIQQHKENEPSVKEDLFEAILGAIAIDSGWDPEVLETSVSVMLNIEHYLDKGFSDDEDYVSLIQQWSQKENGETPLYEFKELRNGNYEVYLELYTERGYINYRARGYNKSDARRNVAKIAYLDLEENDELFTIIDELPNDLSLDNAINVLQELSQKGYISMPRYYFDDEPIYYDEDGSPEWTCQCIVDSENCNQTAYASSKKIAKKYAAYLAICKICGLEDKYEKDE